MKLLKTLLKWVGILLSALIITVLLTVIFDWPVWLGMLVFIVILCIILFVIHLVRKKIYQYRTGFITKETEIDISAQSSLFRYKEFIEQLQAGQQKHLAKNIKSLPWALNLTIGGPAFFDAMQHYSLASTTSPDDIEGMDVGAKWAATENLVVLSPEQSIYENFVNNDSWTHFLEEVCKWRPDMPFNKIIISISLKDLLTDLASITTDKLAVIHQKIKQIYEITGFNIPVAMVFTDVQLIENSEVFLNLLTNTQKQQSLGVYSVTTKTNSAADLYSSFVAQLNDFVDEYSLENSPEHLNSIYQFIDSVEQLSANVLQTCDAGIPKIKHKTALLTGLFFIGTQTHEDKTSTPLFVQDLIHVILNKQNIQPYQSVMGKDRAKFREKYKLAIVYFVYGILLLYMLYSFSGTNQGLRAQLKSIPSHVTYNTEFSNNLITISSYNNIMENIIHYQHRWTIRIFPFHVGLNKIEQRYTKRFKEQFSQFIIPPLNTHIRHLLEENKDDSTSLQHAYLVVNLIETLNIIEAKLNGQSYAYISELDSPQLQYLGFNSLSPEILRGYGNLLKFYIWSINDKPKLLQEKASILRVIKDYNLLSNDQDLDWMVQWANTQQDVKPIQMKDFWHGSTHNKMTEVEGAYTKEGARRIHKLIKEVNLAMPRQENMMAQEQKFKSWYMHQRLNAWYKFALDFNQGTETLTYSSEWSHFFDSKLMLSSAGPYYKLLNQLDDEFSDMPMKSPPSWLVQIKRFYRLLDFAVSKSKVVEAKNLSAVTHAFLKHVTSRPSAIANHGSLKQIYNNAYNSDLHAAEAFLDYQIGLDGLFKKASASMGTAYKIAEAIYFTPDEKSSPQAKQVYAAYASYRHMRQLLSDPDSHDTVFWSLIRGPLDYYIDYTGRQASCFVQQEWATKVINMSSGITGDELTTVLFGQKGLVWKFATQYLQPFVQINNDLFVPRIVLGHMFPLNNEFYSFINYGLTIQTVKKEQALFEHYFNENGGRSLTITSLPTTLNSEASALPYKVSVTTMCDNKAFFINNYNFRVATSFRWKLGQCGPTKIVINFKGFSVTKNYPSQYGFAHFITDYLAGPVTFSAADFPTEEQNFSANNIKTITLNYKVEGLEDLSLKLSKFLTLNDILLKNEHAYLVDGKIPNKITLCWDHSLQTKIYKEENSQITALIRGGN